MDNNYLIHYGVLGMKWGVRKKNDHIGKVDLGQRIDNFRYKRALKKRQKLSNDRADIVHELEKVDRKLAVNKDKISKMEIKRAKDFVSNLLDSFGNDMLQLTNGGADTKAALSLIGSVAAVSADIGRRIYELNN